MTSSELLHWLIDAQTVGGLLVLAALAAFGLGYLLMIHWIVLGSREDED